ncbi:hypothetical protein RA13_10960 [Bacillus atrophaeus]|nr:hypothetical protein RA13_10960 [Bacillus atrophaeus]
MIDVGDSVTIEYKEENQLKTVKSKAVSVENGELFIAYPVDQHTGRTAFLHNGTEVMVEFVGKDEMPYQFKSSVKGRKKDKIPMICLLLPSQEQIKRIQRRQYLRISAILDVYVQRNSDQKTFQTFSYNISAGGIALLLPENLSFMPEEELHLRICLPEEKKTLQVDTDAIVKRVFYDTKSTKYKMTLEYSNIASDQQQLVLQYCFRRQLENRRKRLAE